MRFAMILPVFAALLAPAYSNGPLTSYSKIHREGDALVLMQHIVASDGQQATNTVHYTLEEGGNTLVEDEKERTPAGDETNHWVSTRESK